MFNITDLFLYELRSCYTLYYNIVHNYSLEINSLMIINSVSINFSLKLLILAIILNYILNFFFLKKVNNYIFKFLEIFNLFLIFLIFVLTIIRFYWNLKFEYFFSIDLFSQKDLIGFFFIKKKIEYFCAFSSTLGDILVILMFITGTLCLDLLGEKNLLSKITNINIFYIFFIFMLIMVSTHNLFIMFICFEFIFLPTIYYVLRYGYHKKTNKSNQYLFMWTFFGSFLVFCNLIYIYIQYKSLDYFFLQDCSFSLLEEEILFTFFLIGFSIKIPLIPLHYWLIKVHVYSPTAFSIFLSGFLVKGAVYCLMLFLTIFSKVEYFYTLSMWVLFSLIGATLGLWLSMDLKRIIAWATIQEMSFILTFFLLKQFFINTITVNFLFLHGILSSYMFYIVDILYKRYNSRNIFLIKGTSITFPQLTVYLWLLLIIFIGFPFTPKFFVEWTLIILFINISNNYIFFFIFFINGIGSIIFAKYIFDILYGVIVHTPPLNDLTIKEQLVLNSLLIFFLVLMFISMD